MTVDSNSSDRDPPPMDDDGDDSFEFFSLRLSPPAMCAADEVFFAGKLLPFVAPPPATAPPLPTPPPPPPSSISAETHLDHPARENAPESLEAARPPRRFWAGRGGVAKANYRRLRPASDPDVAAKAGETARQRPRWYLFVLGSMRVPATMDLSEMRSRQQRRQRYAAEAPEPSVEPNRGTWKLLRSLSCKGLESAGVSVAFGRDLQGV